MFKGVVHGKLLAQEMPRKRFLVLYHSGAVGKVLLPFVQKTKKVNIYSWSRPARGKPKRAV